MIRLHNDIDVGVATHTGQVRSHNEDDYLVVSPDTSTDGSAARRLFAVADGMGGVSGGAEASRAAVRSLGAVFLAPDSAGLDPDEIMQRGFAAACQQVFTLSKESPRLHEMGTTMTALILDGGRATVGHVGDSRCVLVRAAEVTQITEDHAMSEPRNVLTRCIGAGQSVEEVDIRAIDVGVGDALVLMSDGVWTTVEPAELAGIVQPGPAQPAADRLIELANSRGGPDNSTVVVVRVVGTSRDRLRDVDLPADEPPLPIGLGDGERAARQARWPWLLIAIGGILIALVVARVVFGFELFPR